MFIGTVVNTSKSSTFWELRTENIIIRLWMCADDSMMRFHNDPLFRIFFTTLTKLVVWSANDLVRS